MSRFHGVNFSRWHRVGRFLCLIVALSPIGCEPGTNESDRTGRSPESPRRVIVLGFDGVDPDLVREFIADGDLPHIARLRDAGTLSDLATTNPAESPVSWASFAVGANPGKTQIFDFLYRIPDSYQPDLALVVRDEIEVTHFLRVGVSLAAGLLAALLVALAIGGFRLLIQRLKKQRPSWIPRARWCALTVFLVVTGGTAFILFAYVPDRLPTAALARQGIPFWESVGLSGKTSSILQVPVTFPATPVPQGRLLTGLGTPDIRASWGTFAIYASRFSRDVSDPVNLVPDRLEAAGTADSVTGGKLVHLILPNAETEEIETFLYGPDNFTLSDEYRRNHPQEPTELRPSLFIRRDVAQDRVRFRTGEKSVEAAAGEWTDWLEVDFELNALFSVRGIVRFYVRSVSPDLYVYASPINFDPLAPPPLVPLSSPRSFSGTVARRLGRRHETVGWAIATNPLKDELISEEEFLQDLEFSFDRRWSIIQSELQQDDWQLLVGVMLAPDRVQHMFWRYRDLEHPRYRDDAPPRIRDAIRNVYRRMDAIVGEVMDQHVDENTDLFVISDHGFASYRKGVHLNSWLVEEGFMTLENPDERVRGRLIDALPGKSPSGRQAGAFSNVDWSRTRAYSLGLGKIYLNLAGREPEGIVFSDQVEELTATLVSRLEALTDPETGGSIIKSVYRRDDIYRGEDLSKAGDLIVGFERGYRVSWDTAAGQAPEGILETNLNNWSGAHCSVDPSLVAGFLVSNRRLVRADPSIIDLAPTILNRLQAPIPDSVEGRDLLGESR